MSFEKKSLVERMMEREFIISIQIDPPARNTLAKFNETIEKLIEAGVRVVDINSSRRISHDSIQLSVALTQRGLETIPHVTTRDSSINGLVNQIFSAHAWGNVQNFLIILGDPYEAEQAIMPFMGVFQTNAAGAIEKFDEHLRRDEKIALDITLAAAVNQNAKPLDQEGRRLEAKEAAGADFFMTQPVFNESQARQLFSFYHKHVSKPLLVGIWPLVHARTIKAIHDGRIVGVEIPDELYKEGNFYKGNDERLQQWGLEKAYKLIELIRRSGKAQGVYIVAPFRNPLLMLDLFTKILPKRD